MKQLFVLWFAGKVLACVEAQNKTEACLQWDGREPAHLIVARPCEAGFDRGVCDRGVCEISPAGQKWLRQK